MTNSPQRAAPQFDLPSGTMLGKYEILRKIAMGGMAEIYLARVRGTAGFEKTVVIKRILPTVANDPNFVRMFLDEARLAATLQHPNIADVHEVGEDDGTPYFAMEFVHGQDVRSIRLAARERQEPVPLAIALAIIHGTASALDYAHDRTGPDGKNLGLVHRDVSSSNVLVSYEGAIKLIDFGIARATTQTHKTQVGTLKGKIPYMSPEQCRGHALDRRSDLWSLGVIMYELTAGRRPFRGENDFAIMDQIVHHGAQAPSTLMRGYPPELEAIVMKLLARKVDERYQSAEEMLHDLDPFIAQHRLWVSPKPLSRYMRAVFAEKVSAWDESTGEGEALAAHVASTITSESRKSELVTPPSAFPGLLPLSQEMPAVRPTDEHAVARPDPTPTPRPAVPAPVVDVASQPTHYPQLKPSGSKALLIILGILVVGAGAFVGITVMNRMTPAPAASEDNVTEPTTMTVEDTKPDVQTKPVVEPAKTEPAAKPEPAKPEPAKTEPAKTEPEPAVARTVPDEPVTPSKKAGKKPSKQPVVKKQPPVKTTPVKPPPTKTEPPKDQAWDPNSPFLPPSN